MSKAPLSLQPSEAVVVQAAAAIYSAYIVSGRVAEGQQQEWIQRSIREAYQIAKTTDESIQSDSEFG